MGEETKISWCDSTINFWEGCTKVSAGCANCYAESRDFRYHKGEHWGKGKPRLWHENAVKTAVRLNKRPWVCDECGMAQLPTVHVHSGDVVCVGCETYNNFHRRRIFSLSLGDWLDPEVPVEWLARMLDTIRQCDQCDWLLCTKRPELWHDRLWAVLNGGVPAAMHEWLFFWADVLEAPKNVWILATAENQEMADLRVPELEKMPAVVRGLSCEPLLGPIKFRTPCDLTRIDWVIVGGESGRQARPCNVEWIRDIEEQTLRAGVKVFVKQLGSHVINGLTRNPLPPPWPETVCFDSHARAFLRDSHGGDWHEWPNDLKRRELPQPR